MLKNIFISGCILYPAKNTCIKSLYWTNYSEANLVSIENEAWAKGWPDFRKNSDKFKRLNTQKILIG